VQGFVLSGIIALLTRRLRRIASPFITLLHRNLHRRFRCCCFGRCRLEVGVGGQQIVPYGDGRRVAESRGHHVDRKILGEISFAVR
jgi:hypothetical protein